MAKAPGSRQRRSSGPKEAEPYRHPTAEAVLRPEIGTQPQFKKKKPPHTYRYDSSLSPALEWDGGNAARERGEALPEDGAEPIDAYGAFRDRMLEVLRRSPVLHVGGGKVVTLTNVRPPARGNELMVVKDLAEAR